MRSTGLAFVGEGGVAADDERARDAREVGGEALGDAVDEIVLLRIAADVGERQDDDREARRGGFFGRGGRRGLRLRWHADFERIDPDRLGDVLELGRAEIADREIEPPLDLPIGVLGQTDRARLGDALQPRGDIDAVAHQVAVALLDHVAEMDADPKFDALVRRDPSVALDHRPLDFNGAVHCVDDTAELDNAAVAGALDDAAVVHGDGRIDQVAAERPQPRQNPVLVGSGKPRIADHVGHQDRGQFSGLAHGATPPRPCQPFRVVRAKPLGGIAKTREECRSLAWAWPHFHAALRRTWKQGVQPCVSTGRSIHAVPSITPSPREGICPVIRRITSVQSHRSARSPRSLGSASAHAAERERPVQSPRTPRQLPHSGLGL